MTASALVCFILIVLAASLRAFSIPRPGRGRGRTPALPVLGKPEPTLDLVGGERRRSLARPGDPATARPGSARSAV